MELIFHHKLPLPAAEVRSSKTVIHETEDALDIMANASYSGALVLILRDYHLTPGFFDLSTGIAGEVLQKFSTYNMKIAIVGDFSKYKSRHLKDFIRESNKGKLVAFLPDTETAFQWFS